MLRKIIIGFWFVFESPLAHALASPTACDLAEATSNLSPEDSELLMPDIDKLVAAGLVDKYIGGDRPFSYREIFRIFQSADAHLADSVLKETNSERFASLKTILDFRNSQLHFRKSECPKANSKAFWFNPARALHFFEISSSGARQIPPENGVGTQQADLDALNSYRNGQTLTHGHLVGFDVKAEAQISPYFAWVGRPKMEWVVNDHSANSVNTVAQELYLKGAFGNLELQVGRAPLQWGPQEFGGLLMSNNARPLDLLKLTNATPLINPWIFKYLGPTKYTFFIANLGGQQKRAYDYLYGLRISILPTKNVELGFHQTFMFGGDGSPPVTWYELPLEMIGKKQNSGIGDGRNISDQRAGWDGKIRFPSWNGLEWYYDCAFDDAGSSLLYFLENLSYTSGFYFPMLDSQGRMNLRLQYSYISPIMFRHSDWGGYSLERHLIGANVESSTHQVVIKYGMDVSPRSKAYLSAAWERRSGDQYKIVLEPDGLSLDHYYDALIRAKENAYRLEGEYHSQLNAHWKLVVRSGVEEVLNYQFQNDNNKVNYAGGIEVWGAY